MAPTVTGVSKASIYLDELVHAYLPSLIRRRFSFLRPEEAEQFSLMGVLKMMNAHPPINQTIEEVFDWVICRKAHVLLVPDDGTAPPFEYLALRNITAPKTYAWRCCQSLILDELKKEKNLDAAQPDESAPRPPLAHSTIPWSPQEVVDTARHVRRSTIELLNSRGGHTEAVLDRYEKGMKVVEIASDLGISKATIYRILEDFSLRFHKALVKAFGEDVLCEGSFDISAVLALLEEVKK